MRRIRVDLPEPFAPSIPWIAPRSRRSETSSMASDRGLLPVDLEALGDVLDEECRQDAWRSGVTGALPCAPGRPGSARRARGRPGWPARARRRSGRLRFGCEGGGHGTLRGGGSSSVVVRVSRSAGGPRHGTSRGPGCPGGLAARVRHGRDTPRKTKEPGARWPTARWSLLGLQPRVLPAGGHTSPAIDAPRGPPFAGREIAFVTIWRTPPVTGRAERPARPAAIYAAVGPPRQPPNAGTNDVALASRGRNRAPSAGVWPVRQSARPMPVTRTPSHMRPTRLAALPLLLLVVAACGSTAPSASTAPTATAPPPTPVGASPTPAGASPRGPPLGEPPAGRRVLAARHDVPGDPAARPVRAVAGGDHHGRRRSTWSRASCRRSTPGRW